MWKVLKDKHSEKEMQNFINLKMLAHMYMQRLLAKLDSLIDTFHPSGQSLINEQSQPGLPLFFCDFHTRFSLPSFFFLPRANSPERSVFHLCQRLHTACKHQHSFVWLFLGVFFSLLLAVCSSWHHTDGPLCSCALHPRVPERRSAGPEKRARSWNELMLAAVASLTLTFEIKRKRNSLDGGDDWLLVSILPKSLETVTRACVVVIYQRTGSFIVPLMTG